MFSGVERFRSEGLDPGRHDLASFTCGEPSLDKWLREQAHAASERRTARTWVWTDDVGAVVAYYALAAHKIARAEVPHAVGRGSPAEIPAALIAKLALAAHLQGRGLGVELVADALDRIVQATQTVAARVVVVEALTEQAACFYERLGFRRCPDSLVLVQKTSSVEAAIRRTTM